MKEITSERKLTWLSFAFVFSCLLGQGVSYWKIYLVHLIMVIFLAFSWKILVPEVPAFIKKTSLLLGVFCYLITSLIWSVSFKSGLQYLSYWVVGLTVIFLLTEVIRLKGFSFFYKVILVFFAVHTVLSLLETLGIVRWPISSLSDQYSIFMKDYNPSVRRIRGLVLEKNDPTSFFWGSNNAGLFSLLLIPSFFLVPNLYLKIALLLCSGLLVFFSGSSAMMALLVLYLGWKALSLGFHKNWKTTLVSVGIVAVACALILTLASAHQIDELRVSTIKIQTFTMEFAKFVVQTASGETYDYGNIYPKVRERFGYLTGATKYFKEYYGFGVGAGTIKTLQFPFEDRFLKLDSIHFYWVEILLVGGVLCFILYLAFLFKMGRDLYRTRTREGRALLETLVIFFIACPVISSAIYYFPKFVLYGACLGYLLHYKAKTKQDIYG